MGRGEEDEKRRGDKATTNPAAGLQKTTQPELNNPTKWPNSLNTAFGLKKKQPSIILKWKTLGKLVTNFYLFSIDSVMSERSTLNLLWKSSESQGADLYFSGGELGFSWQQAFYYDTHCQ